MLISLLLIQQRLTDLNLKFLNMAQKRAKSASHHGKKKKVELNICEAKPLCKLIKKEEPNDDPSRIEIKKEVDDQKEETKLFGSQQLMGSHCRTLNEEDVDKMAWKKLVCTPAELRLDIVLKCGQSFRWKTPFDQKPDEFVGVLGSKIWILKQEPEHILYKTIGKIKTENVRDGSSQANRLKEDVEDEQYLHDYFQLGVNLGPLYESWATVDPVFKDISKRFTGVRMLRQDPVENIFSFICSSNNNIQRISGMIENLCIRYGEKIASIDTGDRSHRNTIDYYTFPTLESLCDSSQIGSNGMDIEQTLRSLSFGYRASYIAKTAKQIAQAGGYEYLLSLRSLPYDEAKEELLKLTGIGPKVSDCILLMSLDKPESIPVDTHMFQIAAKKYLPHLRGRKTVTDKVYKEISNHFKGLYGDYAGWAHSVLFSADLRHLQGVERPDKSQINSSNKN